MPRAQTASLLRSHFGAERVTKIELLFDLVYVFAITQLSRHLRCHALGIQCSMGTTGDCYDSALAESFFATLECELLDRRTLRTHEEARSAIFTFIESFYNRQQRHSALWYLSPEEYVRRWTPTAPSVA
jgi:putative transposase